jgi:hypothetical protein
VRWGPSSRRCSCCALTVLADHPPDLSAALERVAVSGYIHFNLDGTAVRTDRVAESAPMARTCGGPENTSITEATCRSSRPRTAGRCGSPQPARDPSTTTTSARAHGLVDALNRLAATLGVPTLTDLGSENIGHGFRHPVKKPKGGELTELDQAFNAVLRGVHAVAERANAPC